MNLINRPPEFKIVKFREFLLQRNPDEKFIQRYIASLGNVIVLDAVKSVSNKKSIFEITQKEMLLCIYEIVKSNTRNIKSHNTYSGAVSAYIKFLDGKNLRKRVSK